MERVKHAIRASALLLVLAAAACRAGPAPGAPHVATASDRELDSIAQSYVKLSLGLGEHDPSYVESYYGPPEWKAEAGSPRRTVEEIQADAAMLRERLARIAPETYELIPLRHSFLVKQIVALRARAEILGGRRLSAGEAAQALWDAPPTGSKDAEIAKLRARLSRLLPATGSSASAEERYAAYRSAFVVPPEKVEAVVAAAVAESRRRTKANLSLPDGESFRVEYTSGESSGVSSRYEGSYSSVVRIRRDVPFPIDRALDVAAGEGYPGRHVYRVLVEKSLFRDHGWVEFSILTRPSPRALIEDAGARFAADVAFRGGQRTAFERDVLFPLAGLDRSRAAEYAKVREVADRLAEAGRPAAEGEFARDLIRRFVESRGKSAGERWRGLDRLLTGSWTPSDLARASEPNMVPNAADLSPR
jgi:hypothetical protein